MKIVIPGGSGAVGSVLAPYFHAAGNEVVVLSRTPHPRISASADADSKPD